MLRIGTRGSKLALWQANDLKSSLLQKGISSELVIIKTKGDIIQHLSFDKIEGKGFFTKEIEDALLAGTVDVAVHSLKDLPTSGHEELAVTGLSERANPCDLLIIHPDAKDAARLLGIKQKATIGTSSIRRKIQIGHFDAEAQIVDLRGNVPTRIQKVRNQEVDAIVIASAGVDRLKIDLGNFEVVRFNPREFIPAPAQGVVAYQCRKNDHFTRKIIQRVHHPEVSACSNVERKVLQLLDGGCQLPLGVYCTQDEKGYHCDALLGSAEDNTIRRISFSQSTSAGMAEYIVSQLMQA